MVRLADRSMRALEVISELVSRCEVSDIERSGVDKNLTQLHDNAGACERIFKTPIPVAYTRMTSRVLSLWHITLPFALWNLCQWLTIPATFLSALALFYIEEVGVLIEEPFPMLDLVSMSDGVLSAVDGLSAAHQKAMLVMGILPLPPCKDHVVITLKGSRSFAAPERLIEQAAIVLTRVNSFG